MSYLTISYRQLRLLLIAFSALIISACGGGGGGGGSTPTPATGAAAIFIASTVDTRIARSGTGIEYYALVRLNDKTYNGANITTATVDMNGTTLTFQPASNLYEGYVMPDSAGKLNLTVTTAAGDTATASTDAITAIPVLTGPTVFDNAIDNVVTWSTPTGMPSSVVQPVYSLTMKSAISSTRYATISGTSGTFSAGCCAPAGAYDLTFTARAAKWITGAATNSIFWVTTSKVVPVHVI